MNSVDPFSRKGAKPQRNSRQWLASVQAAEERKPENIIFWFSFFCGFGGSKDRALRLCAFA